MVLISVLVLILRFFKQHCCLGHFLSEQTDLIEKMWAMSTAFGSGSPVIRPFVIIINLSFPLKNYKLSLFNNGKGGFFIILCILQAKEGKCEVRITWNCVTLAVNPDQWILTAKVVNILPNSRCILGSFGQNHGFSVLSFFFCRIFELRAWIPVILWNKL